MSSGGSKAQTIGYRYYMDIHMGIGRGPVDSLIGIKVGDVVAWQGSVTENATISINRPGLFGGDKKEGGIVGALRVLMGASTQVCPSDIAAKLGGLVPAFRGTMTLFWSGQICANNPYPKPWKFRVRRALSGWDSNGVWYPDKARILIDGGAIVAMNPAHIIYECLTNPVWGRGLPRDDMDEPFFVNAANTFCAEGFGLCIRWSRQESIDEFIQNVVNHIGAALYVSRITGKWRLRAIRDDYDPDDLPVFDYDSGLLSIQEEQAGANDLATNEMLVNYIDPITGNVRQVTEQNLALIQSTGEFISDTADYLGLPTEALARRIARRDLEAQSKMIKRFKLKMDRRAYAIEPAMVFRISVPSRGITNLVLRAGKIEDSVVTDGTITVTAIQDVFGLPATGYSAPETGGWTPPDVSAQPVTSQQVVEASYRDLAEGYSDVVGSLQPDAGYFITVAARPSSVALEYDIEVEPAGGDPVEQGRGDFTPSGVLASDIGYYDTEIVLESESDLDLATAATTAIIGDEIVKVVSVDTETLTITVERGCVDTVPAPHAAGSVIWFYQDYHGKDDVEYASGETLAIKALTRTNTDRVESSSATAMTIEFAGRAARPYPPGNVKINDTLAGAVVDTIVGAVTWTWAHRDRIIQDDQIVSHEEADVGPEDGTFYRLRLYDDTVMIRDETVSGGSYTYDTAAADADGWPSPLRWVLSAHRDTLDSWQAYDMQLDLEAP